jgi:hypothetical protein
VRADRSPVFYLGEPRAVKEMICWLLCVVYPRWAAIGASELKRASSSCAWPRAAIVPIVPMSCVLMRIDKKTKGLIT